MASVTTMMFTRLLRACVARGLVLCRAQRTCFVSQMPVAVHIRTFKPLHTTSSVAVHIRSVHSVQHEQNR